jgi:hypothetical protein
MLDAAEAGVMRTLLLLLAAAFVGGCETSSAVTQSATPVKCQVTLATPPMMDAGGGSGSLAITTQPECAWDVSTSASWISSLTPASGQGPATVAFSVAANDGSSTRDGTLTVNGEQVRVTQRAQCRYEIGPSSQNVSASGGSGTIAVTTTSDCAWTAASRASWITINSGAAGTGNGSVAFTVAANGGAARTGTVEVSGRTFTVSQGAVGGPAPPPSPQPPGSCSYSLSSRSDNAPVLGGSGTVEVRTTNTCAWTASSNASWITVTSGASGTGDGRVGYLVLPNVGGSRSGTLTIATQTFTVTQAALVCSYSISPNTLKVASSAGSGTIAVSTSSTCPWTASSNDSWITVTAGASGTGNGTVTVTYTANPSDRDRKGTLTVAGRTATVEQKKRDDDEEEDDDE